jgi:type III secretion protein U
LSHHVHISRADAPAIDAGRSALRLKRESVLAGKNDGADKSERPTPKRLRDARKKGDVAKSKDLAAGLLTLGWAILFALAAGYCAQSISTLADTTLRLALSMPFEQAAQNVGWQAVATLSWITAVLLIPIAFIATFAEFMQAGPIMTFEKMKFSLDKLNPMEGLKRMFGMDGLFELVKTLVKVLLIAAIAYFAIRTAIGEAGQMVSMTRDSPVGTRGPGGSAALLGLTWWLTIQLFGMVVAVFFFVAVADRIYSKHRYIKQLKMSRRDIRQEYKEDEGDPYVKSARKEMHQEWANQNAVGATRGAHALLVNPTHIAIALDYDPETAPVPVIAAKGAGELAAEMRRAAVEANVPIVRNIAAARTLWARGEIGEMVPQDMFDAIAAIILWAAKARDGAADMDHDMDRARSPRLAVA